MVLNSKMKILITGANGFIGRELVAELTKVANWEIFILVRNSSYSVPTGVTALQIDDIVDIDLTIFDGLTFDIIIHAAGRAHVMKDSATDPLAEFQKVNVLGTVAIAKLSKSLGVKQFIFLSSLKVNGERTEKGVRICADSPAKPCDPYALSKLQAELSLRRLSHKNGFKFTIIRPPLVYGPGVKGNFDAIKNMISQNILLPLGSLTKNKRSMIGIVNLVDLIRTCIGNPGAYNEVFLVSDDEDVSTFEFTNALRESLDSQTIIFPFPPLILRLVSRILKKEREINRLVDSFQVDISKTRQSLNWTPPFGFYCGIEDAVSRIR